MVPDSCVVTFSTDDCFSDSPVGSSGWCSTLRELRAELDNLSFSGGNSMTSLGLGVQQAIYMASLPSTLTLNPPQQEPHTSTPPPSNNTLSVPETKQPTSSNPGANPQRVDHAGLVLQQPSDEQHSISSTGGDGTTLLGSHNPGDGGSSSIKSDPSGAADGGRGSRLTNQLLLISCSEHGRGVVSLPVMNPGTQPRLKGKYLWDTSGLMNTLHTHGLQLSVATMQDRTSFLRWVQPTPLVCEQSCSMLQLLGRTGIRVASTKR